MTVEHDRHIELPVLLGTLLRRGSEATPRAIGELDLAPHQARATATLVERIRMYGGALLADAVGLGKTRVCLACAEALLAQQRQGGQRGPVWFVVPARLVDQWTERATKAGFRPDQVEFVTHSAMSRDSLPPVEPAVVIVDEAHRFRNPGARRYASLVRVASGAPVLLATATPVANDSRDLLALLRIFLGDGDLRPWLGVDLQLAFEAGGAPLERLLEHLVVRRTEWDGAELRRPRARLELLPYEPGDAEAWVWQHLGDELGSSDLVLLRDDWPRGLFVEHALRLWESGAQALADSLRRLVDFHRRWLEADAHGAAISRVGFRELFGPRPEQSVLPFMFGEVGVESGDESGDSEPPTVTDVEEDLRRLSSILRRVEAAAGDQARERAVTRLLREEPSKTLIFTSFKKAARSTFDALVTDLGPDARVGLVTGDGAVATGLGRVDSTEVLRRFSPGSFGISLPVHQSLDHLVATDCIGEGVDLQDCGRIVLADLPYSPLRTEQRIGRLLRPGSRHDEVVVHLPRPRNWNDSLGMRRRLSTKLGEAARTRTPYSSLVTGESSASTGIDPLSALTRRDAWFRTLPDRALDVLGPEHRWVVEGTTEDALWVFARLSDGEAFESFVARVTPDLDVTTEWSELLLHVDELTRFDPRALAAEAVRAPLERAARARIDEWIADLNGARLAPFAISLDSVQHRAWSAIVDWANEERVPLDRDELRDRLLRPWPRGIERTIEAWIEAPWRGIRQWESLPMHPADRRVEIVSLHVVDLSPPASSCNAPHVG